MYLQASTVYTLGRDLFGWPSFAQQVATKCKHEFFRHTYGATMCASPQTGFLQQSLDKIMERQVYHTAHQQNYERHKRMKRLNSTPHTFVKTLLQGTFVSFGPFVRKRASCVWRKDAGFHLVVYRCVSPADCPIRGHP